MDPPSGRVPEQGLDWFLVVLEACGGGTPDLGYFLEVWVYIRDVGVGNKSGGPRGGHEIGGRAQGVGAPPTLVGSPGLSWPNSFTPRASFGPQKVIKNWHINWTLFDIPFLRNSKTRKKETGTGL